MNLPAPAVPPKQLAAMYLVFLKPVNVACQVIRPGKSLAIQIPNHRMLPPPRGDSLSHDRFCKLFITVWPVRKSALFIGLIGIHNRMILRMFVVLQSTESNIYFSLSTVHLLASTE